MGPRAAPPTGTAHCHRACRSARIRCNTVGDPAVGSAGVKLIASWWHPILQCPNDLLSVILAVPGRVDLKIDESLLNTHLVCFSRHSVLDTLTARILLKSFVKEKSAGHH